MRSRIAYAYSPLVKPPDRDPSRIAPAARVVYVERRLDPRHRRGTLRLGGTGHGGRWHLAGLEHVRDLLPGIRLFADVAGRHPLGQAGEVQPGLRLVAAVAHHAVLVEGLAGRRRGQDGLGRRRRTGDLDITTLGREGGCHRQERDGAVTGLFHFSRSPGILKIIAWPATEGKPAGSLVRRSGEHLRSFDDDEETGEGDPEDNLAASAA